MSPLRVPVFPRRGKELLGVPCKRRVRPRLLPELRVRIRGEIEAPGMDRQVVQEEKGQ